MATKNEVVLEKEEYNAFMQLVAAAVELLRKKQTKGD